MNIRKDCYENEINVIEGLFNPPRNLTTTNNNVHRIQVRNVVVRFSIASHRLTPYPLPHGLVQFICLRILNAVKLDTLTLVLPSRLLSELDASTQHDLLSQDHSQAPNMPDHVLKLSGLQFVPPSQHFSAWNAHWSSVALDEGSSLEVYKSLDFPNVQTPSIFLSQSFFNNVVRATWYSNIRRFEYVADFPTATHIRQIFGSDDYLRNLYNLRALTIRLLPHGGSSKLSDLYAIGACQLTDLLEDLRLNYDSISEYVEHMGKKHKLKIFKLLDYDHMAIFQQYHPVFIAELTDWTYANSTWSRTVRITE